MHIFSTVVKTSLVYPLLLMILFLFYCEYITIQTINATSYYRGNRRWPNIAWGTYCIHQYMVWKGLKFKSFIIRLASYLFEVKFDCLWNTQKLQLKVTLPTVRIVLMFYSIYNKLRILNEIGSYFYHNGWEFNGGLLRGIFECFLS